MDTLHVLYDGACPICFRQREWLAKQEAIVPLHFLPHRAEETSNRFPDIEAHLTARDFTAISDDGRIWTGPAASVMCLFALAQHREFSRRLAHPALLPYARTALDLLSCEVVKMKSLLRRSTLIELEEVLRINSGIVRQHFRLPVPPALPPQRA